MNDTQRQVLADKINNIYICLKQDEEILTNQEARVARLKEEIAKHRAELADLEEDIDW